DRLGTAVRHVPSAQAWSMGDVHRGPERPDTPGDQIRVVIELVERLERRKGSRVLAGKTGEIEDHAARERVEDRYHRVTIRGRQGANASHRVADALEQPALRPQLLDVPP